MIGASDNLYSAGIPRIFDWSLSFQGSAFLAEKWRWF
jgi:hypothetical protein